MRVAPPPRRKKGAAPPPQNNGMPAHSPASPRSVRRLPVSTLRVIAAKMRMRDSRIWRALGTRPPQLPRTARLRLQFPRGRRARRVRPSWSLRSRRRRRSPATSPCIWPMARAAWTSAWRSVPGDGAYTGSRFGQLAARRPAGSGRQATAKRIPGGGLAPGRRDTIGCRPPERFGCRAVPGALAGRPQRWPPAAIAATAAEKAVPLGRGMEVQPRPRTGVPLMTIQPLATSPQSQSSGAAPSTTQSSSPDNVSENQFLQLLVAQIQHRDPTNPTDSTAFVTQLAQFSSLEQLVAIHGDLNSLASQSATGSQNSNATQGGN